MKWLYLLFRPCRHKWEVAHVIKVYEYSTSTLPCENKVILRCKKCGDLKTKKI